LNSSPFVRQEPGPNVLPPAWTRNELDRQSRCRAWVTVKLFTVWEFTRGGFSHEFQLCKRQAFAESPESRNNDSTANSAIAISGMQHVEQIADSART
jgi:hypothetical protein